MSWILFALLPPALWAADNYIDKYIIDNYFKKWNPGILVMFMSLTGLMISILILLSGTSVFNISTSDVVALLISGAIFTLAVIPSTIALSRENATFIAALFRTGPVFAYFFGLVFLDEVLSLTQIIGVLVVIAGAILISSNLNHKKTGSRRIKVTSMLLMLLSTFMMSVNALIFKAVSTNELPFWQNAFWQHIGLFIGGLLVFLVATSYRKDFIACIKQNGIGVMGWALLSDVIGLGGRISFYYATLFAPLAIVTTLTSFQPVFTLVYGILLSRFIKSYKEKKQSLTQVVQEASAITIILVGVFLIL